MTTDDFITLLERNALAPSGVIKQLRAKAAQGDDRITPKSILKYLVKKEIVSRARAKELLETTLVVSDKAESSILGLSPLPESMTDHKPAERKEPKTRPVEPLVASLHEIEPMSEPGQLSAVDPLGNDEPVMLFGSDDERFSSVDMTSEPLTEAERGKGRLGGKSSKKKSNKRKKSSAKGGPKNEWDSPLLLVGGGGLALLLIAGGVIYYLLTRENADELLKMANASFDSGQYNQSIEQFESFVKNHSSHQDISRARVRLGMAKIWRDTERSTNYANALTTAKEVINQIEDEPAFTSDGSDEDGLSQAKSELSSLLTTIAEGLAEQADASTDEAEVKERIAQINEVLGLTANTKYVPQRFQLGKQLNAVRETLARVEARQQRGADLAAALVKIDEAIAAGDSAAAFAVRTELVKQHPVLFDDQLLSEKVLAIAAAEQKLVKFVESPQAAMTTPIEGPIVAELALAERRGTAAEGAATPIVIRIDGGLYGLNSGDGALLWRRFVGINDGSYPLLLPSGIAVAADSQRNELVAVESKTGKLAWRLPLEGKLATPAILGNRLLVPSEAGRLYVVDAASGNLVGYVQFSQPIRQPPVVNERGDRIYVLGEHSNLYTLSTENLTCLGVYYLGHAAGGAATPPVANLNKVIVADNSGAETCQIRVLALNDQGAPVAEATSYRLSGLVTTPLQTAGRRFATVTSQGQTVVFEVAASNDKSALTALASRDAQDRDPMARFSLMHDGHLWLAAGELTKLEVLPTGNQLPVRSIDRDYRGDAFDYPLQAVGNLVIHVRRPRGQGGAVVAAMDVAANKALWETAIAVPPAGAPAVDASSQQIVAGSSSGAVFVLNREAMARRVQDQALRIDSASLKPTLFNDVLDLGNGRLAIAGTGAAKIIHYRPNDPRQQLREVEVPGPVSGALASWGDAFAAPSEVGQIYLYGSDDASPLGTPFQPELTPGRKYDWLAPVVLGDGVDARLAVSDGVAKIYLLHRVTEPEPHLEATATVDVGPSPLVTRLAAVGTTVFAGNEAGKLARFVAPDLAPGEATDLGGRVTWGPFAAGEVVLVATDANELIAVGVDGAVKWRQPLVHGNVGGQPLVADGQAFLLYPLGIAKVSLNDGAEGGFVEIGQTLSAGPVSFAGRLVVAAADGTLLVVNLP
jgi:outer membrane protein assembly factor BamB